MRAILFFTLATFAVGIAMLQSQSIGAAAGEQSEELLRHLVLYKFKAEVTPEQVQEVIHAFASLPKQIDTIVGFEHGPNVNQEGKSDGLTYGFVVTFQSQADLDAYIKHPAHQAYVNIVKDRREKVVVFDYWVNAAG